MRFSKKAGSSWNVLPELAVPLLCGPLKSYLTSSSSSVSSSSTVTEWEESEVPVQLSDYIPPTVTMDTDKHINLHVLTRRPLIIIRAPNNNTSLNRMKMNDFVEDKGEDSLLGLYQSIFRLGGGFLYKVKDTMQNQLGYLDDREKSTIYIEVSG